MDLATTESINLEGLSLDRVSLESANFKSSKGPLQPGPIEVQIITSFDDDEASLATCVCSVKIPSSDENSMSIESAYSVQFSSESIDFTDSSVQDLLAPMVMRISYPYHRQMVGQFVSQTGLPPLALPLVPDDNWRHSMTTQSA